MTTHASCSTSSLNASDAVSHSNVTTSLPKNYSSAYSAITTQFYPLIKMLRKFFGKFLAMNYRKIWRTTKCVQEYLRRENHSACKELKNHKIICSFITISRTNIISLRRKFILSFKIYLKKYSVAIYARLTRNSLNSAIKWGETCLMWYILDVRRGIIFMRHISG